MDFKNLPKKIYYAGIGSRETPDTVKAYIDRIARKCAENSIYLRSGGADGADTFFENSAGSVKEIYLPWKGFNGNRSAFHTNTADTERKADAIAKKFHPRYDSLSDGGKKLMRRNAYQVLGWDLNSPSEFIACWTVGGLLLGGTAQALRIAKAYGVKVFNFGKPDPEAVCQACEDFITELIIFR